MTPAVAHALACITLPLLIVAAALIVSFVIHLINSVRSALYERRNYDALYGAIPDDYTPRIVWNEGAGVMVKFGNMPYYKFYSEQAALALPGVRDER